MTTTRAIPCPRHPNAGSRQFGNLCRCYECGEMCEEVKQVRPLVYLAAPHSSPDSQVRHARFLAVNRVAAILMNRGEMVFSPISHASPIADAGDLPRGWTYWQEYDRRMMGCCQMLYVLTIDGWRESKGVQAEMRIAEEMGLPVKFVDENGEIQS